VSCSNGQMYPVLDIGGEQVMRGSDARTARLKTGEQEQGCPCNPAPTQRRSEGAVFTRIFHRSRCSAHGKQDSKPPALVKKMVPDTNGTSRVCGQN